ncbi:MAG: hypothetical protein RL641_25 [Candidatus Parcubacteria bacterium]|jgi:hypothetical protein
MKKYINKTTFTSILVLAVMTLPSSALAVESGNSCRITIKTPTQNTPVRFPLRISGTVEAEGKNCDQEWVHSETEFGNIVIKDELGNEVSQDLAIQTGRTAPFMYPLSFEIVLKMVNSPATKNGTITIIDREFPESESEKPHIATLPIFFDPLNGIGVKISSSLKYGMKGNAQVKDLQKYLIQRGYLGGEPSGNFLNDTKKAVLLFQRDYLLPQTGYVGPATRAILASGD